MIDVRGGRADDLEKSGDKSEVVVDKVKSRRPLDSVWVNFGRTLIVDTRHTSNHFAAVSNAPTAHLTVPRILSTSSQNNSFSSRNRCRAEVILSARAGTMRRSTRCLCHDSHAYRKPWPTYCSILSPKSSTSELTTPSGSLQMFFSNL